MIVLPQILCLLGIFRLSSETDFLVLFLIKNEMRVSTLVRDISFNSLHIKSSSHGIGVHSSVTKMQQSAVIFALK